jgi:rod shape-determining protein MreC
MLRYLFVRRTDWAVFGIACLLSLTLMLLGRGPQGRVVWFLEHTLLAPFHAAVGAVDRAVSMAWENQKLRKRVTQLEIEVDAMRADGLENSRLRRLLDLAQRRPYELLAARVTGRGMDRLGGSLALDKGWEDGVRPDQAVLTPDGLVGRVDRVTPHGARVLTLLHRDCAVAARVERSRVDGVLEWEFGALPRLSLAYVSSQEDVKTGDLVVTSGLGGMFPAGLKIGEVDRVALADNGWMKDVKVRPAAQFRNVEEVLIYLPGSRSVGAPALYPPSPADSAANRAVADSAGSAAGGARAESTATPASP